MPRKRVKEATAHPARDGSKSRSRPNSDENEGILQLVEKNKGGKRTNISKMGNSAGAGKKKSLQGQTQAGATGTRAFATEIQNFLGNTRSGSQLLELRTDGGDISGNSGWSAYSQANNGSRITRGAASEIIPVGERTESDVNIRVLDSLTVQFEDLSVKASSAPGPRSKDTQVDTLQPHDVFSDLSIGYNATSSKFSSSQRYTKHTTSSLRSTSRAHSSSALTRSASATCLFCKARFGPRHRSSSQLHHSTTSSSSSSTSLVGRCQCHRYSKVFNQRNSFRSIAQQSTPIKARTKRSCYKIDISSPDVYGSLMDLRLGSADSQMDSGSQQLLGSSRFGTVESLSQESQSGTQLPVTTFGSQGSLVAEALEHLTQQFLECTLSSSSSSPCSSDISSADEEEHDDESLLGLSNNLTNSPSPAMKKPRRQNPALRSPSLGYIPIAFPFNSKDLPF